MLEVARGLGQPLCGRPHHVPWSPRPAQGVQDDRAGYLELVHAGVAGGRRTRARRCRRCVLRRHRVHRTRWRGCSAARPLGLPVKLHADQLSDLGGAASRHASTRALSRSSRVRHERHAPWRRRARWRSCCLAPSALRERCAAPVELLRRHGVPIALATDCNPGSSPILSILAILNMACTLFGLTPEEALAGVTRHAARALGLDDRHARGGEARRSRPGDHRPAELSYWFGFAPVDLVPGAAGSRIRAPPAECACISDNLQRNRS